MTELAAVKDTPAEKPEAQTEYHVFVRDDDGWHEVDRVNARDPDSAIEHVGKTATLDNPDAVKAWAAVAARYWKPRRGRLVTEPRWEWDA